MKQAVKLFLAGAIVSVIYSCKDEVDAAPGAAEAESRYSGAEEAESEVNALYSMGAPAFYSKNSLIEGPVMCLDGFMSGFFDNESKKEASFCEISQLLKMDATELEPMVERIWEDAYQAIYKANKAIDNIPRTKELSEGQRKRLVSEASFFRAFNYFCLAKHFGGVPPVQSSEMDYETSMLPRTSVGEVYRLIVNDLKSSLNNLPDSAFTENNFRISKSTAETLLADVYLTMSGYPLRQSKYREAAEMARRVINGGKHLLTPNGASPQESAYNRLRTEDRNLEYIYSYQIDERNADEALMAFSLPKEAAKWEATKVKATNKVYMPTQEYLNVYDSVYDLRRHEQQFFHSFYKYERKGKTIIQTFPQASYLWLDKEGLQDTGVSKKDIPIYRYAEILLIAAEAIANAEGVTPEAVNDLTEVRARAYCKTSKAEIVGELSSLSREKFIEQVWIERMREFPFEMKLWADIQRTRKYPVTSAAKKGKAEFVNVVGAVNPWGAVVEEKQLLLPLSKKIRLENPLSKQNPDYED